MPQDFIHLFIQKQIKYTTSLCDKEKEKDKSRQVRLVSVFILNQVNNQQLYMSVSLFEEIQKFCVDNGKLPQVQDLLKKLSSDKYKQTLKPSDSKK